MTETRPHPNRQPAWASPPTMLLWLTIVALLLAMGAAAV